MKDVVLDTETTGLSVQDGHRVVEIGCIELENLVPTKNQFHCYLNPERKVSEKALKIHGYTDEFLLKQKKFSEVVDDFLNFIERPENKAFSFLYLIILLILYVSLHLKTYYYLLANNNTFSTFQKNNTYLVGGLFFILGYIGLKIVVDPIHFISEIGIYKMENVINPI